MVPLTRAAARSANRARLRAMAAMMRARSSIFIRRRLAYPDPDGTTMSRRRRLGSADQGMRIGSGSSAPIGA